MAITQDRMISLINATDQFQGKLLGLSKLIKHIKLHLLPEQYEILNNKDLDSETLAALQTIVFQFEKLEEEVNKPIDYEALVSIATEKAHFNLRASSNAAQKRYMQRKRALQREARNWTNETNQGEIELDLDQT